MRLTSQTLDVSDGDHFTIESTTELLIINGTKSGKFFLTFVNRNSLKEVDGNNFVLENSICPLYWGIGMFENCINLKTVSFSKLNMVNVSIGAFQNMFKGCTNLNSVDFSNILGVNVFNDAFESMFADCRNLTTVNFSRLRAYSIFNNGFKNMFNGCTNLTLVNLSIQGIYINEFQEYAGAFVNMFKDCTNLSTLNLSHLVCAIISPTTYKTMFTNMFTNCANLQNLYINVDGETFKNNGGSSAFTSISDNSLIRTLHTDQDQSKWDWVFIDSRNVFDASSGRVLNQALIINPTSSPTPTPTSTPTPTPSVGITSTPSPTPHPTPLPPLFASLMGDSYVTCFNDDVYKIQERNAVYRFYKDDKVLINVKIERIENDDQINTEITLFAKNNNLFVNFDESNLYHVSEVYVKNIVEGKELTYNFNTDTIDPSSSLSYTNTLYTLKGCSLYKGNIVFSIKITMYNIELYICISHNPQLRCGIELLINNRVLPADEQGLSHAKQVTTSQYLAHIKNTYDTSLELTSTHVPTVNEEFLNHNMDRIGNIRTLEIC